MFKDYHPNEKLMHKHNEFVPSSATMSRKRDVEYISKPYPQFYKIVLRSDDLSFGTNTNATFTNITMPERFSTPAVLQVESFAIESSEGNADLTNAVYEIKINLPQPRTWDSKSKTNTYTMAIVKGHQYFQTPAVHNSGIPILDPLALQNQPLNIQFDRIGVEALDFDDQSWILTLTVISYDDSVLP